MMRRRPTPGRRVLVAWCAGLLTAGVLLPIQPASAQSSRPGSVVVIANGWSPADAGAAAPLAGRFSGVMLYASAESLGAATVNALRTLVPSRVILVGGVAALSADVEAEIRRLMPAATVERLSGTDRLDTAARAALLAPAPLKNRPVVMANGWSPSDVGTAAPLAARLGGSVLYASRNALGRPATEALRQFSPSQVILVGGNAALSGDIDAELSKLLPGVPAQRFAGIDRVDTATRAALYGNRTGLAAVIADGWSTPDVGVAAPLAAALGGSVLFSSATAHPANTHAHTQLAPSEVVLVGGSARGVSSPPGASRSRITGADRIELAAQAALLAHRRMLDERRNPRTVPGEEREKVLRLAGRQLDGTPLDISTLAGRDVLLWLWSPF